MEFFDMVRNKNKKKSEKYSILDKHRGYENGEVDLSLVCKLFRVEMKDAVEMAESHKGSVNRKSGAIHFEREDDAYDFMFFLEKKANSLSVSGRIRYERF